MCSRYFIDYNIYNNIQFTLLHFYEAYVSHLTRILPWLQPSLTLYSIKTNAFGSPHLLVKPSFAGLSYLPHETEELASPLNNVQLGGPSRYIHWPLGKPCIFSSLHVCLCWLPLLKVSSPSLTLKPISKFKALVKSHFPHKASCVMM